MSSRTGYILGALGAALLVAAPPAMAKEQDINKLAVEQSDMYGKYLVTGEGQALYMFTADKQGSGKSTCYSQCADVWPPATTVGEVTVEGEMIHEKLIQTIERKDGAEQITYNGWPLYLFVRDIGAGGPTGQDVKGFGGEWYLVRPDGTIVGRHKVGEALTSGAAVAAGEWNFDDWDTNNDGVITETEFTKGFAESGLYDSWDENDDGVLSEDEFSSGFFDIWDTDDDDTLTADEWDAGWDDAGDEGWFDI